MYLVFILSHTKRKQTGEYDGKRKLRSSYWKRRRKEEVEKKGEGAANYNKQTPATKPAKINIQVFNNSFNYGLTFCNEVSKDCTTSPTHLNSFD